MHWAVIFLDAVSLPVTLDKKAVWGCPISARRIKHWQVDLTLTGGSRSAFKSARVRTFSG